MLHEFIYLVATMGIGLALIAGVPMIASEIIRRRSIRRHRRGSRIEWRER